MLGPLLAMDSMPRLLCFRWSTISSGNLPLGVLYMDLPPLPVPVGSPPCSRHVCGEGVGGCGVRGFTPAGHHAGRTGCSSRGAGWVERPWDCARGAQAGPWRRTHVVTEACPAQGSAAAKPCQQRFVALACAAPACRTFAPCCRAAKSAACWPCSAAGSAWPHLYHEGPNVAVKDGAVVVARGRQGKEVLGCARRVLAEKLQLHVPQVGVQRERLQVGKASVQRALWTDSCSGMRVVDPLLHFRDGPKATLAQASSSRRRWRQGKAVATAVRSSNNRATTMII